MIRSPASAIRLIISPRDGGYCYWRLLVGVGRGGVTDAGGVDGGLLGDVEFADIFAEHQAGLRVESGRAAVADAGDRRQRPL